MTVGFAKVSIKGEESKPVPVLDTGVRVKQDKTTPDRHSRVGGNPQGGGVPQQDKSQHQPHSPSPLMGEESKPVPVPDTGSRG